MGRNYFISTPRHEQECHVSRNNIVDIISLTTFFINQLSYIENDVHIDKKIEELKTIRSLIETKNTSLLQHIKNTAELLCSCYNICHSDNYQLTAKDEYEHEYNFVEHIKSCVNYNKSELGGLLFSYNTDFR